MNHNKFVINSTAELFLGIAFAVILLLLALILFPLPGKTETSDQQIVLKVVSNGTEDKLVLPQAVTVLRLVPVSGPTARSPLSRGDNMICHQFNFQDENHVQHIGFKCGADTYVIDGLRFDSK